MAYEKISYNSQYNKENYTELKFRVKKGQKTIIEAHWKAKGYKSLNSYINHLITVDMQEDNQQISVENNNGIIMRDNQGTINM